MFTTVPDCLTVRSNTMTVDEIQEAFLRAGAVITAPPTRNRLGFVDVRFEGIDHVTLARRLESSNDFDLIEVPCLGRWQEEPADPFLHLQWQLNNTGQEGGSPGADIGMLDAWEIESGDPAVSIGFLDSPIRVTLAELADAFRTNTFEFPGNGLDEDDNGYADDMYGWNFHLQSPDVIGDFISSKHGTNLSALAIARNHNGVGVGSVAGGDADGAGCTAIVCVVGSGGPDASLIDDAILYAVDRGVRVLSLAFAIPQSESVDAAIAYAAESGVFMAAPAGNNFREVQYPASHAKVMAVGATNPNDDAWAFTTPGPEVEISAPGIALVTIGPSPFFEWEYVGGTSYSVALVAGAAALVMSWADCLDGEDVRRILRKSAKDIEAPGWDPLTGWGRLDVSGALQEVLAEAIPGCRCPEDLSGDGEVNGIDLGVLLAHWGEEQSPADLDGDEFVDGADLLRWLGWSGTCR
jgi:serine protease